LFPFVDEPAGAYGEYHSAAQRAAVVDALVRLHRAPPGVARVDRPEVPNRAGLERTLVEAAVPWSNGAYAPPAWTHFARHAPRIRELLDRFDSLAADVLASINEPVLTHGEPHPGNVVFAGERVKLVDWDTVAVAVPERDLWMLDLGDERDQYERATGRAVDDAAIELYRVRWYLDDIASAVHTLRSPHDADADTERTWNWFRNAFETDGVWPYARQFDERLL
jgi:spectinomycin phosphotransferase